MVQKINQSEVALANQALSLVERGEITVIDPSTTDGREIAKFFATVRNSLLRAYPFNFSREQAEVSTVSSAAPKFEFTNSFVLPANCLKVRKVIRCRDDQWRVQGKAIFTDLEAPLQIVYTREVTDTRLWDPLFAEIFYHTLALRIAPKLAERRAGIKNDIRDDLNSLFPEGMRVDANEGVEDDLPEGDFVLGRY